MTPDTAWRSLRMEVQGDELRVRTWTNPWFEPTTWDLEVTDSSVTGTEDISASYTSTGPNSQDRAAGVDQVTVKDLAGPEPPIVSYGWDKQGRLVSESTPDGSRTWSYQSGRLVGLDQNVPGRHLQLVAGL